MSKANNEIQERKHMAPKSKDPAGDVMQQSQGSGPVGMGHTPGKRPSRRRFLQAMGASVMGLCVVPAVAGCELHSIRPLGDGAKGELLSYITPTESFYEQFGARPYIGGAWKMPEISRDDWKLTLTGMGFDQTVRFADLEQKMQSDGLTFLKTMRCVFDTNDVPGLMSTATWGGVPLHRFLPEGTALQMQNVKQLHCYGSDGFRSNIRLERVVGTRKEGEFDVLLVTEMNGQPLPAKHGGPVRIMLHETYGFKNMKFIEKIEFSDKDEAFGHYEESGYREEGVLQVVSKVTKPLTGSVIEAGRLKVVGMAFSGAAAIQKVEVTREGKTQEATIVPLDTIISDEAARGLIEQTVQFKNKDKYPYPGVWARWEFEFDASPGPVELQIRATNTAGESQPDNDTDSLDGSTGVTILKFTVIEKES